MDRFGSIKVEKPMDWWYFKYGFKLGMALNGVQFDEGESRDFRSFMDLE